SASTPMSAPGSNARSGPAVATSRQRGWGNADPPDTPPGTSAFGTGELMMTTYKVGYLIGSLARESINRRLTTALIKLAPSNLDFEEIAFRDLPLYSPD